MIKKVTIVYTRSSDGTYNVYCEDCPELFGMGNSVEEAKMDLIKSIEITKEEIGKESSAFYPDWLDSEYEFISRWDVQAMLEYYSGIITPAALSKISGIHPKQLWTYLHGLSRPRRKQVERIENALHKLGTELLNTSF